MCADCRVIAMTDENFDPFGAPARPNPRTTEDYLREREAKGEGCRAVIPRREPQMRRARRVARPELDAPHAALRPCFAGHLRMTA